MNGQANGHCSTPSLTPDVIALEATLSDLQRRFGLMAVMRLGQSRHLWVQTISTGFPALDTGLGAGGIPRGRVADIYGPESSSKTTLCLPLIAQARQQGGLCVFIDTKHALDPTYAAFCGVRLDDLFVVQPDTGEEALEITEAMVQTQAEVVVIDSTTVLLPRAEMEGEMGGEHAGLQALRKPACCIRQQNTALIFTNQLRQNDGILFGSPEKPTGGMTLSFYASVRVSLRRLRAIKSGRDIIGSRVRATIKKNKIASPFRSAEFDLLFGDRQ